MNIDIVKLMSKKWTITMKDLQDKVKQFFVSLGLDNEEILVYSSLVERGKLTTLEISRATGISRTQVYRLLERMKEKGIVEEIVDEHRLMAQAIPVEELKQYLIEKQQNLDKLNRLYPEVEQFFSGRIATGQPETKTQFYRGRVGLQQMIWHTLRANGEVLGYTYRDISEVIGSDFMYSWSTAFVKKKIKMRDIFSDDFLESIRETKRIQRLPQENFVSRYISPNTLAVKLQIDIYNDVIAHYNWHDGEVFGVEIYNKKIASFHRQIFEIIWRKAIKKLY
jgi:sugar-specific transcriptional regulator TrmB